MKRHVGEFLPKIRKAYAEYEKFIRRFVYTDLYLAFTALIVFVAWATKCAPLGIIATATVGSLVLLGADDIMPLTVVIFGAALMIYSADLSEFVYLWPALIPFLISLIIFIVKNARRKFIFGKAFFPQIAVFIALMLGGAGVVSAQNYARALPNALFLGLGVLAIYILYSQFLKRDGKHDVQTYFAKSLAYVGVAVALELIVTIARAHVPVSQWNTAAWDVGWGNRNNIATYLIITAGLTTYLTVKSKYSFVYYILAAFQYFAILLSFSRGGIVFGAISGVIALVLSVIKAQNKKRSLISAGVILGAALVLYLIFMDEVNAMLSSLAARGMDSSGRDELYKEAWQLFKQYPILGAGFGYSGNNYDINTMGTYWFHSTLFQILASTGLVGLAAYIWFYAVRFKLLFSNIKNSFNLFILAVWIGFEGYSMMDTGTFIPYPYMMLIILTTLLLEINVPCKKSDYYSLCYERDKKIIADESDAQ